MNEPRETAGAGNEREPVTALQNVLLRVQRAEAGLDTFTAERSQALRHWLDGQLDSIAQDLARVRAHAQQAGEAADQRLTESLARVETSHAEIRHRLEAALRKPEAEGRKEARGLLDSISRAVRDAILGLGGPIEPTPRL